MCGHISHSICARNSTSQATCTVPSSNTLSGSTQPTTTTLPMTLHTTYSTREGGLARPDTTRTSNTDASRTRVLLDVPGHKQEEAGVVRRVKTPAHTKKAKAKEAHAVEKAKRTTHKGEKERVPSPKSQPPRSPCRSEKVPCPVRADPPNWIVPGGAMRRLEADSAAMTGGTPAGR